MLVFVLVFMLLKFGLHVLVALCWAPVLRDVIALLWHVTWTNNAVAKSTMVALCRKLSSRKARVMQCV